jgi:hypothetical protein
MGRPSSLDPFSDENAGLGSEAERKHGAARAALDVEALGPQLASHQLVECGSATGADRDAHW